MSDTLKSRIRQKLRRQVEEDGAPDPEHEDTRQWSVQEDLARLELVADDDPLIEELAARYLVA